MFLKAASVSWNFTEGWNKLFRTFLAPGVGLKCNPGLDKQEHFRIFAGLSLGLGFLLLLPTLWFGFGADHGMTAYGAWIWREFGELPYVHYFEGDFPGIFLLNYFIQETLGESVSAFRIFDLLWQSATVLLIFLVSSAVFGKPMAGFLAGMLYAVYYYGLGYWNTGERDTFLLLPCLVSFWLYFRRWPEEAGLQYSVLTGLLFGFAFLVKPVAALPGLLFAGVVFKSSRSKYLATALFALFAGLPFLAFLAWYWRLGHLEEMIQVLFVFSSRVYTNTLLLAPKDFLSGIIMTKSFALAPLMGLGIALYLIFGKSQEPTARANGNWLLVLFAGFFMGYLVQGKYFLYQQAPVSGMMSIFAGAGWTHFLEKFKAFRSAKARLGLVMGLIILSLVIMLSEHERRKFLFASLTMRPSKGQLLNPFFQPLVQAADYVRAHTSPDDKLQVWGGDGLVNYLSRRRCPTRFAQNFPLTLAAVSPSGAEIKEELGREFLDSIQKDPPVYFLVETISHHGFGIASDKELLVQAYPELWRLVKEKYLPEYRLPFLDGFIEFYRLSPFSGSAPHSDEQIK